MYSHPLERVGCLMARGTSCRIEQYRQIIAGVGRGGGGVGKKGGNPAVAFPAREIE